MRFQNITQIQKEIEDLLLQRWADEWQWTDRKILI